jgi:hypothetical protein
VHDPLKILVCSTGSCDGSELSRFQPIAVQFLGNSR